MNGIQVFNNPAFGEIRTAGTPDEPLFCLVDVCKALGLSASHVRPRLDDGVVSTDTISDSLGRTQTANFVNEDGLYDVILDSRKPEARAFRKWITSEVLPTIRKTGKYDPSEKKSEISIPNFEDPAASARAWADMYEKAHRLEAKTQEQQKAIEAKDKKITEDAPKVAYADALTASDGSCLIAELAKVLAQNGYETGQNRLFKWLREHHYLGTKGDYYNMPMQQYIEQGIFKIRKEPKLIKGEIVTFRIPMVTAKGQQYFINKFLSKEPMLKFE